MLTSQRRAFTMMELIFVIVIIGILSAVAVPKLAATRDDATITKARSTVAAVRNAVATERQKRILKGDFVNPINNLRAQTPASNIFDNFNPDRDDIAAGFGGRVLEYPVSSCATLGKTSGCWQMSGTNYRYVLPAGGGNVDFTIGVAGAWTNRFDCVLPASANCRLLTE